MLECISVVQWLPSTSKSLGSILSTVKIHMYIFVYICVCEPTTYTTFIDCFSPGFLYGDGPCLSRFSLRVFDFNSVSSKQFSRNCIENSEFGSSSGLVRCSPKILGVWKAALQAEPTIHGLTPLRLQTKISFPSFQGVYLRHFVIAAEN
jgi:hypothetical protein